MPGEEDIEKYRKLDGTIDWGKRAMDWLTTEQSRAEAQKDKKPLQLEELGIYKLADELSGGVWQTVAGWDWLAKKTAGEQWVRATDSIGANIAEGYGRYFFGENIVFLYYARGSLKECRWWLEKAKQRLLITDYLYQKLKEKYQKLEIEINKVVKSTKGQAQKWKGMRGW